MVKRAASGVLVKILGWVVVSSTLKTAITMCIIGGRSQSQMYFTLTNIYCVFSRYHKGTMRSSNSRPIHISLLDYSARRSSFLLLFVFALAVKVLAYPPADDSGCIDWWTWAGDKAPGVGHEFETEDLQFFNSRCNTIEATDALTRKLVGGVNINTAAFKIFTHNAMGVVVFYHDEYKRGLGLESPV